VDGENFPTKAICIVTHNIGEAVLLADDARRQLDIAIDWGRYGELYDYDSVSDDITADPAAGIHPASSSTTTRATT